METDSEDTMLELAKELIKSLLYAITDIETFQPKPRRITVVSRVYRLLGLKSTTPTELFSRKVGACVCVCVYIYIYKWQLTVRVCR